MSDDQSLTALSPLDGRYAGEAASLREYFSEQALIRSRLRVEIEYLIALADQARLVPPLNDAEKAMLRRLVDDFSPNEAAQVKAFEIETRHDVKALEYFMREKIGATPLAALVPWLHFGLTSEDVTGTAQALTLRDSRDQVLLPAIDRIIESLARMVREYKAMPMLARTHGQPAVPTTLGKEIAVFVARLRQGRKEIAEHAFQAKLTGAVGNLNALFAAAPQVDWLAFGERLLQSLGLTANRVTTQIAPYDNWVRYFDAVRLLNSVLLDLAQDLWRYISDEILVLKVIGGEVGSSTMPQKVNPIDFENAEGNLGLANALLAHYAVKLPVSRLQRDLSDSTVRRSFGEALGHTLVAWQSLARGLERVQVNEDKLRADLEAHWEVISEGAQTILRAAGVPDAYELVQELTRGRRLSVVEYDAWIDELAVAEETRVRLRTLSPFTYLGIAEKLAAEVAEST